MSGRIIDFVTDVGVSRAVVTVSGATATTDAAGFYSLIVPAGEQTVSIDGETVAVFVRIEHPTYRGD